jgi:hypothetical protein
MAFPQPFELRVPLPHWITPIKDLRVLIVGGESLDGIYLYNE